MILILRNCKGILKDLVKKKLNSSNIVNLYEPYKIEIIKFRRLYHPYWVYILSLANTYFKVYTPEIVLKFNILRFLKVIYLIIF